MDIINALKRGIVFYIAGFLFLSLYQLNVETVANEAFVITGGFPTMLFILIPFFFMGFISALLED